jgi:alkanesulfonate monooxygenase SsuD/methylene tetrahydromethanopterin reductase-like flavin-dependent oxidoreductase (luciferase family)
VYAKHTPARAHDQVGDWSRAPLRGTVEQIVDTLRAWQDAGLGYAILYFPNAAGDRAQLERFATEVVPALR